MQGQALEPILTAPWPQSQPLGVVPVAQGPPHSLETWSCHFPERSSQLGLGGDPSQSPPSTLSGHDWRPACGVSITQPLMFSKAEGPKDLTLVFHNQDGLSWLFLPGLPGWGLMLGRTGAAHTTRLRVRACHPPGGWLIHEGWGAGG